VLAHAIATTRARQGQRVVVCDPDALPGMWPGCTLVGSGDGYAAIEATLQTVQQELESRRHQRAEGRRAFPALTLVLSEAADILTECPTVRPLFETMLRRARKLNVGVLVDVQDDQVGTLHLEGASRLKVNFSVVVEVRRTLAGQRVARINGTSYAVPVLPDPEALAEQPAGGDTQMVMEQLEQMGEVLAQIDGQRYVQVTGVFRVAPDGAVSLKGCHLTHEGEHTGDFWYHRACQIRPEPEKEPIYAHLTIV
jgi:hypothetical protein